MEPLGISWRIVGPSLKPGVLRRERIGFTLIIGDGRASMFDRTAAKWFGVDVLSMATGESVDVGTVLWVEKTNGDH